MEGEIFDPSRDASKSFSGEWNGERYHGLCDIFSRPFDNSGYRYHGYYNYVMYGDRFDGENGNETGITVLPRRHTLT